VLGREPEEARHLERNKKQGTTRAKEGIEMRTHCATATRFAAENPFSSAGTPRFTLALGTTAAQAFPPDDPSGQAAAGHEAWEVGVLGSWRLDEVWSPERTAQSPGQPQPDEPGGGCRNPFGRPIDLGTIGIRLRRSLDAPLETDPAALEDLHQALDLGSGTIITSFRYAGQPVTVQSMACPGRKRMGFRISSELVSDCRLTLGLRFRLPPEGRSSIPELAWPSSPPTSVLARWGKGSASILRQPHQRSYRVDLNTNRAAVLEEVGPDEFAAAAAGTSIELVAEFIPDPTAPREHALRSAGYAGLAEDGPGSAPAPGGQHHRLRHEIKRSR
jgi:hypothetical protein